MIHFDCYHQTDVICVTGAQHACEMARSCNRLIANQIGLLRTIPLFTRPKRPGRGSDAATAAARKAPSLRSSSPMLKFCQDPPSQTQLAYRELTHVRFGSKT